MYFRAGSFVHVQSGNNQDELRLIENLSLASEQVASIKAHLKRFVPTEVKVRGGPQLDVYNDRGGTSSTCDENERNLSELLAVSALRYFILKLTSKAYHCVKHCKRSRALGIPSPV